MARHWLHTSPRQGAQSLVGFIDLCERALADGDTRVDLQAGDWGASFDAQELADDAAVGSPLLRRLNTLLDRIADRSGVRVVVDGRCLGPGFALALSVDAVDCGPRAVLGSSEVRSGLLPLLDTARRALDRLPADVALGIVGHGDVAHGALWTDLFARGPDPTAFETAASFRPRPVASPLPGGSSRRLRKVLGAVSTTRAERIDTECRLLLDVVREPDFPAVIARYGDLLTRDLFRPVVAPGRLAVMGTGQMGATIAASCAAGGVDVTIVGRSMAKSETAAANANRSLRHLERRGPFRVAPDTASANLSCATEVPADVEGVIEAVAEEPDVKRAVFARARAAAPSAWLASTSSSLPLAAMGDDVALLHFAYPAEVGPFVEVAYPDSVDATTAQALDSCLATLGKAPLYVRSVPGYVLSRLLFAYMLEAVSLVEQGTPPDVVDTAAVASAFAVPPLSIVDAAGISLVQHVASEVMAPGIGPRFAGSDLLARLGDEGADGRKAGRGLFVYDDGVAPNPSLRQPARGQSLDEEEIGERLRLSITAEALRCVSEGLGGPAEVDMLAVAGVRFPATLVGPVAYAISQWDEVTRRIEALGATGAPRFAIPVGTG